MARQLIYELEYIPMRLLYHINFKMSLCFYKITKLILYCLLSQNRNSASAKNTHFFAEAGV